MLGKIRDDLTRWMTLPLSWLGRVAIIKMNVLPRLLYPMQMVPILLSNKVIKELNGWLSLFIWSKRKPRLKLSKLQLPGAKGGLDLPNFKLYQLACQLRFIVEWLNEDPKSVWLDLESSQSKCPLQNLLFVRNPKLSRDMCDNPLVRNTLKAWRATQRLEDRIDTTSPLLPILNNPEFLPSTMDPGFNLWLANGICRIGDLFEEGSLLSFDIIASKYKLPRRFLQIRDYIFRNTTLTSKYSFSVTERILLNPPTQKLIT